MPRRPRLFIPNQPQHVVVRGHNRDAVFVRPDDFKFFYQCLKTAIDKNKLAVHAWVFMHNHIHLLVTPGSKESLPKTMQSIGRRYGQYFNRRYQRSGSIWEGRYKSCMVDTDNYLLCCYRYIELNPVRAGLVKQPGDYSYSSYHTNAYGKPDAVVTAHQVFIDFLGGSVDNILDRALYRELCREVLDSTTIANIRQGTTKGFGIGQADFLLKIADLS